MRNKLTKKEKETIRMIKIEVKEEAKVIIIIQVNNKIKVISKTSIIIIILIVMTTITTVIIEEEVEAMKEDGKVEEISRAQTTITNMREIISNKKNMENMIILETKNIDKMIMMVI